MFDKLKYTASFAYDIEDYNEFFDSDWSDKMSDVVKDTPLNERLFNLVMTWSSISGARALPWLVVKTMTMRLNEENNNITILEEGLNQLIDRINHNLLKHNTTLIGRDKRALLNELSQIQEDIIRKRNQNKDSRTHNSQNIWENIRENPGLTSAISMCEQSAYTSLYFAYEVFLVDTIKSHHKLSSLRVNNRQEFKEKLSSMLESNYYEILWKDKDVELSRLIRHAFVHNGGNITKQLENRRNELDLLKDSILIFPHRTNVLFHLLKDKIENICYYYVEKYS